MARWLARGLFVLALASVSCQKDEGPPLPGSDSMKFDLSFPAGKVDEAPVVGKENFAAASGRVGLLNAALGVALAPPTLVFAVALSTQPTFSQGVWTYAYSVTSGATVWSAALTAWFDGNAQTGTFLNLSMMVSCPKCATPTSNFVWYTGRFNTAGTDGSWQFFSPEIAQADQKFVKIAYDITDATHKSLTFTNNRTDGNADAGDVIQYLRNGDQAKVSVHDQSAAVDYVVEWSISTGSGSITVPGYNGGLRACWDSSQMNSICN